MDKFSGTDFNGATTTETTPWLTGGGSSSDDGKPTLQGTSAGKASTVVVDPVPTFLEVCVAPVYFSTTEGTSWEVTPSVCPINSRDAGLLPCNPPPATDQRNGPDLATTTTKTPSVVTVVDFPTTSLDVCVSPVYVATGSWEVCAVQDKDTTTTGDGNRVVLPRLSPIQNGKTSGLSPGQDKEAPSLSFVLDGGSSILSTLEVNNPVGDVGPGEDTTTSVEDFISPADLGVKGSTGTSLDVCVAPGGIATTEGGNWVVAPNLSRRQDDRFFLLNVPPATDHQDDRKLLTTNVEIPPAIMDPTSLLEDYVVAEEDTSDGDTHGGVTPTVSPGGSERASSQDYGSPLRNPPPPADRADDRVVATATTKTLPVVVDPAFSSQVYGHPIQEAATVTRGVAHGVRPGQDGGATSSRSGQDEESLPLKPYLALFQGDGHRNTGSATSHTPAAVVDPFATSLDVCVVPDGIPPKEGGNWVLAPNVSGREDEGLPLPNPPPAVGRGDGLGVTTTKVETPPSILDPISSLEVYDAVEGDTAKWSTHREVVPTLGPVRDEGAPSQAERSPLLNPLPVADQGDGRRVVTTTTKTPPVVVDPAILLEAYVPSVQEAATTIRVVTPSVSPGQDEGAASSSLGQDEGGVLPTPRFALDQGDGRRETAAMPVDVDQTLGFIQDGRERVDSCGLEQFETVLEAVLHQQRDEDGGTDFLQPFSGTKQDRGGGGRDARETTLQTSTVAVTEADESESRHPDAVVSKSSGQRVVAIGNDVESDRPADFRVPEERLDAPGRQQASVTAADVSASVTTADMSTGFWSPYAVESEPSEYRMEPGGVVSDAPTVLIVLVAMLWVLTATMCVVCFVETLEKRHVVERRQLRPEPPDEGDQASASVESCCCMGHQTKNIKPTQARFLV